MTLKIMIPWILTIAGLFFLAIGCKFLYGMWLFKKSAVKSVGTVVKIKTTLSKAKDTIYSPVILFQTNQGEEINFDVNAYSDKKYEIGEKIEVLYLENKPNRAKVNSEMSVWGAPGFVIALGVVLIGIGIYFFTKSRP